MFKADYRKELDNISASEKFKKDTISLMKERLAELQQSTTESKTIKFNPNPYRKIVASVAIMLLAATIFAYSQSDFAISTDNAKTESSTIMEQDTEKSSESKANDNEYNFLPNDVGENEKMMRLYTINDAVPVKKSENTESKDKIAFSTQSNGGMGFEAHLYFNSNELSNNHPFNTYVDIEILSVYQYQKLTYDQMHSELDRALNCLGVTRNELLEIKCHWHDVPEVYNNTTTTYSFDAPETGGVLDSIYVRFDGGVISIDEGGIVSIDYRTDVPDYTTNQEYTNYISNKYGKFIGENPHVYSWHSNSYDGYITHHNDFYNDAEDISAKLFNCSVMRYKISHLESVLDTTRKNSEGLGIFYTCKDSYLEYESLPAISYNEALWLLYNGLYYTTVPYSISESDIVSKVEMVYKEPPVNYQKNVKEGWAVPFYKFYVERKSLVPQNPEIETDRGTLKTFGVYYVCAIHPDYIEITNDYIQIN